MVNQNNYFAFAENDYEFFKENYEAGKKRPALAAMGQSICERYLKHIINEYAIPEDETEHIKKESTLHTHSLNKLIKYLKDDMEIDISDEEKSAMQTIDGFYFTTRYPGDDSFIADESDVDSAWIAVEAARDLTLELIREFEKSEPELEEEDPER